MIFMSNVRFSALGPAALALLTVLLAACSSTQLIEETPTVELELPDEEQRSDDGNQEAQADDPQPAAGSAQPYSQDVAGAISELYGKQAEQDLSDSYWQAIDRNPGLRYNIVYFEYDKAVVSPEGRRLIKEHALYLQSHPDVRISIEGHTDERGSADYNIALGERRANAVRGLLLAYGAPAGSLSLISYGEERPALRGHTEQAYSKNRRTEIIYY